MSGQWSVWCVYRKQNTTRQGESLVDDAPSHVMSRCLSGHDLRRILAVCRILLRSVVATVIESGFFHDCIYTISSKDFADIMEAADVDSIAASLVREYLSRKVRNLRCNTFM